MAQLKVERGWVPGLARIGRKRTRTRTRKKVAAASSRNAPTVTPARELVAPAECSTAQDLLERVETLRVQAAKLVGEANVDSPEGYWLGDVHSVLARLVNQGTQLLLGEDASA